MRYYRLITYSVFQLIIKFHSMPDFKDLQQYYLTGDNWDALQAFYDILSVHFIFVIPFQSLSNLTLQIPHAFQQHLSVEKTPTLCKAIRSFSAITEVWKEHQVQYLETSNIVQAGINKMKQCSDQTSLTPAYTVAMCMSPHICIFYEFDFLQTLIKPNN